MRKPKVCGVAAAILHSAIMRQAFLKLMNGEISMNNRNLTSKLMACFIISHYAKIALG